MGSFPPILHDLRGPAVHRAGVNPARLCRRWDCGGVVGGRRGAAAAEMVAMARVVGCGGGRRDGGDGS
eukprot:2089944-Prymnesium_polylepis.1